MGLCFTVKRFIFSKMDSTK